MLWETNSTATIYNMILWLESSLHAQYFPQKQKWLDVAKECNPRTMVLIMV